MAKIAKKLSQVSQQAMDRLDLPVNLASGVARMELLGNRSLYIDRHRGVLAYSAEAVDINAGTVVVRVEVWNFSKNCSAGRTIRRSRSCAKRSTPSTRWSRNIKR